MASWTNCLLLLCITAAAAATPIWENGAPPSIPYNTAYHATLTDFVLVLAALVCVLLIIVILTKSRTPYAACPTSHPLPL